MSAVLTTTAMTLVTVHATHPAAHVGLPPISGAFTRYPWWDALRVLNAILGLSSAAWFLRILLTSPPRDHGFRLRMTALILCSGTLAAGAIRRLNDAPTVITILQLLALIVTAIAAWSSSSGQQGARENRQAASLSVNRSRDALNSTDGSRKPDVDPTRPGEVSAQADAERGRDPGGPLD
jgi:hypothetical protein